MLREQQERAEETHHLGLSRAFPVSCRRQHALKRCVQQAPVLSDPQSCSLTTCVWPPCCSVRVYVGVGGCCAQSGGGHSHLASLVLLSVSSQACVGMRLVDDKVTAAGLLEALGQRLLSLWEGTSN